MMLTELTTVPDQALPLADLKDHIRLGSGFAEDNLQDELLKAYLRSALATIENRTSKVIFERTFEWVLFEWRSARKQPLPLAPVTSIVDIFFEPPEGDDISVPDGWLLRQDNQRPSLIATGAGLPNVPSDSAIKIQMVAGYGAAWADVPKDMQQAVMMLAAHFYENRTDLDGAGGLPMGVQSLIEPYRTVRIFMGNS